MDPYNKVPTNDTKEELKTFSGYGKRHTQAILIFSCMVTTSCVRGCLSVAILAMTDSTLQGNKTMALEWDKPTQGLVMSSYHWGDMVMQIPAGYLVCKYGGKPFLLLATTAAGLSAFITPLASQYGGWQGACVSRVILGVFASFIFPCIHTLLGKWAPISERNRLGIMIYSGFNIALIIGNPISAYIGTSSLGWPWIFYSYGLVCLLNAIAWYWIGANSPAEHTSISRLERDFIEASLGEDTHVDNKKVPWRQIFKSKPVLALIMAQCCIYFSYTVVSFEIPTFFKIGLNIDLESSGGLASLPYIASIVSSTLCCLTADYLLNKSIFSLTVIRKLFNTLGCAIPSICLILLMYIPEENKALAVTLIIVIIAGDTLTGAGIMLNHIDLSPNFAAIIVSWSMTISDIGNIFAPIVSGNILTDPTDMTRWRTVFLMTGAIYTIGNIFFVVFGSAQKQWWDDLNDKPNVVLVPSDLTQELQQLRPTNSEKKVLERPRRDPGLQLK